MIAPADLIVAALACAARHAATVAKERDRERAGVAQALDTKSAYSDSAWKTRHAAELRLRAANAVVEAIGEVLQAGEIEDALAKPEATR